MHESTDNGEPQDPDWSAWEVEPLPVNFADAVLGQIAGTPEPDAVVLALPEPKPSTTRTPRLPVVATVAALAAAAAVVVTTWPSPPPLSGIAASAASEDAAFGWTSVDPAIAVQTAGRVRWDVAGDVPLTINTAAGDVHADHAAFTLEMLDMSTTLNKPALAAGVTVTGAVAAVIWMHSGDVEVANAHGSTAVAAPSAAVMTDSQAPRLAGVAQRDEKAPAPAVAQGSAAWKRARAQIKGALAKRAPAAAPPSDSKTADDAHVPHTGHGLLSKEYIRETVREDVLPLVKECYDSVLADEPELEGRMVLEFSILGDESVGGIVDTVEFVEGSEITNPGFRECVGESMASAVFEPPEGGGEVVVRYPFVFKTADTAER